MRTDAALAMRGLTPSPSSPDQHAQPAPSSGVSAALLGRNRLAEAKAAFTTRRAPKSAMITLLTGDIQPRAGDLVLARIKRLGQHSRLQLISGRRARLYRGDEIIVCYGNRYAACQFEALVPASLAECSLVAGGGVAARVVSQHDAMQAATVIQPIGLLGDTRAQPLNLKNFSLPSRPLAPAPRPVIMTVVGTEMNAGKTTTAVQMIRSFGAAGLKVAAAKITGTGAGGDYWEMLDAGAFPVLDFTDMGVASTWHLDPAQMEDILGSLVSHLMESHPEVIVLEIADGLLQTETAALLASPLFKSLTDGLILAAADAIGAAGGAEWLRRQGLPLVAISGVVSASALGRQAAEQATGLPVYSRQELAKPETAYRLLPPLPALCSA